MAREDVYNQNRYGVSPETLSVISARNRIYATLHGLRVRLLYK